MGLSQSTHNDVPVYGFENGRPAVMFYVIHIMALVLLSISASVSFCLTIFLFKSKKDKNLFRWPIGERLVVYLALSNLLYSVVHMLDHSYMLAIEYHPPRLTCMTFGFFLSTCALLQAMVVLFTAFNAFFMVVLSKKIPLGKYDIGFFLYAVGIPVLVGILGLAIPFLGPQGPWCMVDMGNSYGPIVNNLYSGAMLITIIVNIICYGLVWAKISQAARAQNSKDNKYHKSAKVMMLFVTCYIVQWLPFVVYSTWNIFSFPSVYMLAVAIFFANLGGLLNFGAYLFIRFRYQRQTAPEPATTAGVKTVRNTSSTGAD